MMDSMRKSGSMANVLLLGANGLVGQEVLTLLRRDPRIDTLYAPTRRPLAAQQKLVNPQGPDILALVAALDAPIDCVFSCLGTTRRAAGSKVAFHQVDYRLVVETAAAAKALGASQLLVVSALGADAGSRLFYNRTKGEMEQALQQQDWPRLTLGRPSMLIGDRQPPRPLETLSAPLFRLLPGKWQAITASDVARALYFQAFSRTTPGVTILESDALRLLARNL